MSDRIKSLRSKLNATEAAMQKIDPGQQQKENKNDDQPSLKTDTAKAFRDRLAAAQEKQRLATTLMTSSSSGVSTTDGRPVGLVDSDGTAMSPMPQTSAGSRAAALRARLHAVKEKTTGEEF
jgi:acetyl-CoA carboxylase beta subunit